MATNRRATIKDVARAAGVAPATVSNVLNHTAPVSPQTRGRVLAAAAALGYRRNLVAHLIRLGHRRIGLLTIGAQNPRAEGYRLALQDAGIPYDPALVSVSNRVEPDLIALGRYQTEQLLASAARPTAIFGITDLMAMGALRALKEAGL